MREQNETTFHKKLTSNKQSFQTFFGFEKLRQIKK
jgi:hypothetical protein